MVFTIMNGVTSVVCMICSAYGLTDSFFFSVAFNRAEYLYGDRSFHIFINSLCGGFILNEVILFCRGWSFSF